MWQAPLDAQGLLADSKTCACGVAPHHCSVVGWLVAGHSLSVLFTDSAAAVMAACWIEEATRLDWLRVTTKSGRINSETPDYRVTCLNEPAHSVQGCQLG